MIDWTLPIRFVRDHLIPVRWVARLDNVNIDNPNILVYGYPGYEMYVRATDDGALFASDRPFVENIPERDMLENA